MWGYWKEDNDIDFVAALNPVLNKGDKSQQTYRNFKRSGSNAAITTQCKNAVSYTHLDVYKRQDLQRSSKAMAASQ